MKKILYYFSNHPRMFQLFGRLEKRVKLEFCLSSGRWLLEQNVIEDLVRELDDENGTFTKP